LWWPNSRIADCLERPRFCRKQLPLQLKRTIDKPKKPPFLRQAVSNIGAIPGYSPSLDIPVTINAGAHLHRLAQPTARNNNSNAGAPESSPRLPASSVPSTVLHHELGQSVSVPRRPAGRDVGVRSPSNLPPTGKRPSAGFLIGTPLESYRQPASGSRPARTSALTRPHAFPCRSALDHIAPDAFLNQIEPVQGVFRSCSMARAGARLE